MENSESDMIPDHLRNLYAGQEATVRTGHGTTDWFQTGKRVRQGCILSPYLTSMKSTSVNKQTKILHAGVFYSISRDLINLMNE